MLLGLAWSSAPLGEELGCPGSGEEVKREREEPEVRGGHGMVSVYQGQGQKQQQRGRVAASSGAVGCLVPLNSPRDGAQ